MAGYRDPIFDFKSYSDQIQSTWNQQNRTLQDKQRKNGLYIIKTKRKVSFD